MNKTAMQWLYDELAQCLHREEVCDLVYKLEQKAKEMEREQIQYSYDRGLEEGMWIASDNYDIEKCTSSSEFYNATYGGQDE
jgi:hypothetical protein